MKAEGTKHIIRFGTVAEKQKLIELLHTYDILCINGNSTAYMANAISKLITANISAKGKAYIIDPITYAFQGDIKLLKKKDSDDLKKSIKSLIEIYGSPIKDVIEKGRPILPEDFDDKNKEGFCNRVIEFQLRTVKNYLNDNGYSKYLDYIKMGGFFDPELIIAPYFYLDDQDPRFNDWLKLNLDFFHLVKKNYPKKKIFVELVISKSILVNTGKLVTAIEEYSKLDCDGIALWIDDFNEHIETIDNLNKFVNVLKRLKDKHIYIMYGGYFSILLTHEELNLVKGVSHGLEYGEHRPVYPVGGGLPVSKYYFYPLHHRINTANAAHILLDMGILSNDGQGNSKRYFEEICDCKLCKSLLSGDMRGFLIFESKGYYEITRKDTLITYRRSKADKDTKEACLEHYMACKCKEFNENNGKTLKDLILELKNNQQKYAQYNDILEDKCDYLNRWAEVLETVNK